MPSFTGWAWAKKRMFKFLLKRHLGRCLKNDLDIEMLDVQIDKGTLDLQQLLLDTDYINEQLVRSSKHNTPLRHIQAVTFGPGVASVYAEVQADLGSCDSCNKGAPNKEVWRMHWLWYRAAVRHSVSDVHLRQKTAVHPSIRKLCICHTCV